MFLRGRGGLDCARVPHRLHDHLGARWYHQGTGRFLTRDSYPLDVQHPRELNRYLYTANNPVNATDPSGMMLVGGVQQHEQTIHVALLKNTVRYGLKVSAVGAVGLAVLCAFKLAAQQLFFVALEGRCTRYSLSVQYQGDDMTQDTPGAVPDTRGGYMVSFTLMDDEPIRARRVRHVILTMFLSLNQTQRNNRHINGRRSQSAYGRAIRYTQRCEAAGGCTPPGRSGFINEGMAPSQNTPRIDIPIHSGLNIVSGAFPTVDVGF